MVNCTDKIVSWRTFAAFHMTL